ncbi:hypothetical protein MHAS_00552 [Mycolicibacterium hassiacum DSM 44199]|nr:hypothetical protein MHAS_00552 [Mycolicibacterium hassiacum DSM 44199]
MPNHKMTRMVTRLALPAVAAGLIGGAALATPDEPRPRTAMSTTRFAVRRCPRSRAPRPLEPPARRTIITGSGASRVTG